MKRILTIAVALALVAGISQAQELRRSPGKMGFELNAACVLPPGSITQSLDCDVVPLTGITCANGETGENTDTSHLRRFTLSDDGIVNDYTVSSVDFGVEVDVVGTGVGNPVTLNTWSIAIGDPFLFANMTLLDSNTVDLGGVTGGTVTNVPVAGTVDPAIDDLVVEVLSFDHSEIISGGMFFPGANGLGQTGPAFVAAADCGLPEPMDLALLGFPDSHNVVVVNGSEAGVGGIPCEDIEKFLARCNPAGTVQVRVKMFDNSHSGETVTIAVDGVPVVRTIFNNIASHQVPLAGPGPHTIELLDPAGCFAPLVKQCAVGPEK